MSKSAYEYEKDPYQDEEEIFKLYQNVSSNGYLKIICCYKKDINKYNHFVREFLKIIRLQT